MSCYSVQIFLLLLYLKLNKNNHWIDAKCDKASLTVLKMYFKIWNNYLHPIDVRKGHYPTKTIFTSFLRTDIFPLKISSTLHRSKFSLHSGTEIIRAEVKTCQSQCFWEECGTTCGMMWDFQSIKMVNFNFHLENNMKYLQPYAKF